MNASTAQVSQLIDCTPAAAFDAFADPNKITQFWLRSASAPLSRGARCTWHFMVPGAVDTVRVDEFDPARLIALSWSDGSTLRLGFAEHAAGRTRVSAEFSVSAGDAIEQIVDTAAGYTIALCDLKTFLESGRSAHLVRAKAELVAGSIGSAGPLEPAAPSAEPSDFDFIIGRWRVLHRRLNERLSGCTDWTEFDGTSSTRKILGGFGNVEDNVLQFPGGEVRAAAVRSFDPRSGTWAIWWLDGRAPHSLGVPVVGRFDGPVGTFLADDSLDGRAITVRFVWRANPGGNPQWEQAFSADGGKTWEINWVMEFVRP